MLLAKRKRIIDKFSDCELLKMLENADSFQSFLKGLGYKAHRSQNVRLVAIGRFEDMGVDYRDYLKPQTEQASKFNRIPDEEYYTVGVHRGSHLARRFKKDNLVPYRCAMCENAGYWMGKELSLQVDHIDGDNTNNILTNIRWLCPNCHTQTDTFCKGKIT